MVVCTRDIDRAVASYRDVLGLEVAFSEDGIAFLRTGSETGILLHDVEGDEVPGPAIGFEVDDVDVVAEEVEARGASVSPVQSLDE